MKVPLSWLKDYVDITLPVPQLAERMTLAGLEVTGIEYIGLPAPDGKGGPPWDRDKIFVGQIREVLPHPNADRLTLAVVDYGHGEPLTVVTGAPNIRVGTAGQKVPFATLGARLIDGHHDDGRTLTLKAGKLRGVASMGMVLSEKELGLSDDHTGIIILPDDAPVGTPLADYMGDVVIEFEVLPSTARTMCIIGVAREVAALTGAPLKVQEPAVTAEGEAVETQIAVEIADPDLCYRFTATLIRNVTIGPSPFWMQQRLRRVGMRPINNIVDITNYVMLEWGQPLHAFDYDKLAARAAGQTPKIIVRRARPGETLVTLDGATRDLSPDMLMITDTAGPIAVGGVMGGLDTEVTESSRNILLEAANFDNINIRRTVQALRLPSEAASRFGRGVPAEMPPRGARRAAEFMRTLAGGTVARGMVDAYPTRQPVRVVDITPAEVQRVLGMAVDAERIAATLAALEFKVEAHGDTLRCTVPWYRLDVSIAADLVEEIARIIGYDQIPMTLLADALPPQHRNRQNEGEERVRDILIGCGLQDTITYGLLGPEDNAKLLAALAEPQYTGTDALPAILPPDACIRLANPLTPEHDTLRTTLLTSALLSLAHNVRYAERLAQFEIGRVFLPQAGQLLPAEPGHISIALTGPRQPASWHGDTADLLDFFDLKGIVETLLQKLGLTAEAEFVATQHPAFTPFVARLHIHGQDAGILGEVHPKVRQAFDLPDQRVCVAELRLAPFLEAATRFQTLAPISNFPAVREDLALVVDEAVQAKQVADAMQAAGGNLLRDIELFDVYRGKPIASGHKSLAYRLTWQDTDRTLSTGDIAKLRERVVKRVQQELGATLRA